MHAAHARPRLSHRAAAGAQMAHVSLGTKNGKRAAAPTVWAAASSSDEDTDGETTWRFVAAHAQPPPRSSDEGAGPSGHGSLSWTFVDVKDPRCEPVLRKLAEGDAAEREAEVVRRARAKNKAETKATLKARRTSVQRSLFPELSEPSTAPGATKWWDSRVGGGGAGDRGGEARDEVGADEVDTVLQALTHDDDDVPECLNPDPTLTLTLTLTAYTRRRRRAAGRLACRPMQFSRSTRMCPIQTCPMQTQTRIARGWWRRTTAALSVS